MGRTISGSTDAEWTKMTGARVNRAAQRRAEEAERASLIAELGMQPETGERYAATTGELAQWAREKRA